MAKNIFKIYKKDEKPSRGTIRKKFIQYLKNKKIKQNCFFEDCPTRQIGNNWRGKNLTLIMDHENGNNWDNRIENLRFICPNCAYQLETHGGRNRKKIEEIFDNGYYTVRKNIQEMLHIASGGAVAGGSAKMEIRRISHLTSRSRGTRQKAAAPLSFLS